MCPFELITCEHCGLKVRRAALAAHLKELVLELCPLGCGAVYELPEDRRSQEQRRAVHLSRCPRQRGGSRRTSSGDGG